MSRSTKPYSRSTPEPRLAAPGAPLAGFRVIIGAACMRVGQRDGLARAPHVLLGGGCLAQAFPRNWGPASPLQQLTCGCIPPRAPSQCCLCPAAANTPPMLRPTTCLRLRSSGPTTSAQDLKEHAATLQDRLCDLHARYSETAAQPQVGVAAAWHSTSWPLFSYMCFSLAPCSTPTHTVAPHHHLDEAIRCTRLAGGRAARGLAPHVAAAGAPGQRHPEPAAAQGRHAGRGSHAEPGGPAAGAGAGAGWRCALQRVASRGAATAWGRRQRTRRGKAGPARAHLAPTRLRSRAGLWEAGHRPSPSPFLPSPCSCSCPIGSR